ncbi:hypothetical protein AAMO2058_000704000, partial [Amorphochlora amoebiformis]
KISTEVHGGLSIVFAASRVHRSCVKPSSVSFFGIFQFFRIFRLFRGEIPPSKEILVYSVVLG